MPKVILICGKLCSGKTHYCKQLLKSRKAVLLSCDEVECCIFHHSLGEAHDIVMNDVQQYLHKKAVEIVLAGSDVILDWGFWSKSERDRMSAFYKANGVEYEWHYIDIANDEWERNIASRNRAVETGETTDYYIDAGLLQKLASMFQAPSKEEIDVWYTNRVK